MGIGKTRAYEEGYQEGYRDGIMKDKYKGEEFAFCENTKGRDSK